MKFSILATAVAVAFHIGQAGAVVPTCQADVVINELEADNPSTDTMEFIELYGPAGCSLEGLSVILFNGNNDKSYHVIDLDGKMTDAQGFFVIGDSTVSPDVVLTTSIQNGPDAVALYRGDFPSSALVTTIVEANVIDAVVYGTNADTGLLDGLGQTVQYNEGTTNSLSRIPDGKGTGPNVAGTFVTNQAPTPRALNDPPGQPSFSISDVSAGESDGTMTFTVTRSGDTSETVSVDYVTVDGSAVGGSDFLAVPTATLTFGPAVTTQTISVTTIDDDDFEGNEQFSVMLSNPTNGAAIETATATGTIVDNDVPACQADVVINEVDSSNAGADTSEFIELYGPSPECPLDGLIVILFNGDDDASNGVIDLTGQSTNAEGFFVIGNPGVPNVDLTVDPGDIQNGPDAVVLYRGEATAFPDDTSVADIVADNIMDAIVYDTNDPDDSDLLTPLGQTTQFDEDENGASDSQSLSRVPDGTGTFVAKMPTAGAPNDPPFFSINDAAALESAGTMTFTVTRSGDLTEAVDVTYATSDGTAVQPADYTDTSGTVNFAVGVSSMMISVDIADNNAEATSELSFKVTLTGTTVGFLEDPEGIGTIVDDEGVVKIHVIQGSVASSPLDGSMVSIEGIVTGVFEGLKGFFVQEEDSDADDDDSTSEGIFVFLGDAALTVAVGDKVAVAGTVEELDGLTQLKDVTAVAVESSDNTPPSPVVISDAAAFNLETVEGMLVSFAEKLVVTDNADLGRFGELRLSLERLFQSTQLNAPGVVDANAKSVVITLDDGSSTPNPDQISYDDGATSFSAANTIRSGFCISSDTLTGIAHFTFGSYKLEPTEAVTFDPSTNPRPAAPDDVGGTLKVASFNVDNYFTTLDSGGADTGELARQKDKIVQAIVSMDADIVGLVEVENIAGSAAISDLVAAINAVVGAGTYDFVNTDVIGTSMTAVGFIFKPAKVTVTANTFAVLDSSVDSRFDDKNTPTLAQSFTEVSTSEVITVAVNNFKSKDEGSDCSDISDADTGDGQGNCAATRTNAALALADWLATDPTTSGSDNFLIIGDLNAYVKEDAITSLVGEGFADLVQQYVGEGAYNSGSNGFWGTLSYALASTSLLAHVNSATIWNINADEPSALDYNLENKSADQEVSLYSADQFRSSDRDPIVLGIQLDAEKTCQAASTRDRALQAIAGQPEDGSRPGTSYLRVRALQPECDPGYEYNPESRMCVDLDECATDYPCPEPVEGVTSSFCVDYDPPRRWKCGCLPGFQAVLPMDNNNFEQPVPTTWRPLMCLNENECETRSPCHPNATCTDTIGGYECVCDAGLEGDGITCLAPGSPVPETIMDECQNKCSTDGNQVCAPSKVNNGTFACLCEPGFSQIREGSRCDDDDECTTGAHDCDKNGFCDNIPGSFRCECLPGFVGGGRSCAATESPTSAPVVIEIIETASPVVPVSSGSSGGGGGSSLKSNGAVCGASEECISDNCVFPINE